MPNLDSNLTALRAPGYFCTWYLAAFTGSVVLTGAVTADAADGATSLAYTTSTGDSADVKRGFLVRVTTSGGALKGFWRVRASGTLSSTALPITELSAGSVDINSGDLIEVRDVILPGAKVVEADAAFKPDGVSAGTYNSAIPPMACAGPHWCGFVDDGETYATVAFVGSLSYAVDGDSGGTVTYSWSAPTASGGTTTSTSADPSFTFEAGEHLVTLTVTDSSNSATWTTYRKVRVYDASDAPWEVVVESLESDVEQGTSARFRIFEDGALDDLPDGSLVALFAREWINGTEQSFGNAVSSRSHMKALGYLRRENNANNADDGTKELAFDIVSPMQFYRELVTGYSKVALHDTGANAWDELDDLSVKRMLVQIPRWYTWLTEFHDLTFHSSFDDRDYAAFYIQRSNPIDQMDELAKGVDARITCDRTGSVALQMLPYAIAEGSRSGVTTWGTFTDDDRRNYRFDREHWRPIEMIEGRGFTAGTSGNQPIFSRWPGTAPGAGISSENVERLIADSQSDLNTRLGRLAAWRDGVYFPSTGVLHRAMTGETVFPGPYWFDPAYCEYLKQDFAADTNLRGIDPDDHRFIITRVSSTPDHERGTVEHSVSWRTATNGPAGVTYIPPTEADNGLGTWTPPTWDFGGFPTVPIPGGLGPTGTVTLAAFWTDNTLTICGPNVTGSGAGFDVTSAQGGPVWVTVDLTALSGWPGGTVVDFVVEPDSPSIIGTGTATHGWIITTTHRMRIADIGLAPTLSNTGALTGTTARRSLDIGRGNPDYIGVVSYLQSGGGVVFDYSSDGGSTWSSETVSSHYDTQAANNWMPGLFMDPKNANRVVVSAFTNTSSNTSLVPDGYISTTLPPSFSRISSPDINPIDALATSIAGSYALDGTLLYHAAMSDVNSFALLKRANGATITDVTPALTGGFTFGPKFYQRALSLPDDNPDVLFMCGFGKYDGTGLAAVCYTTNARAASPTWTEIVAPAARASVPQDGVYAMSATSAYFIGTNYLGYWNGTTLDSRMGNLSKSAVRAVGICGLST